MIVTIKGLSAGLFSLGMAIILGNNLPALGVILGAMALGCFSYGISIVLFIHAMRGLGRHAQARCSVQPVGSMTLSFLLFQEFPSWMFMIALILMVIGTIFWLASNMNTFIFTQ